MFRKSIFMLFVLLVSAITAFAYDFPSTNDQNRANGLPHVNFVSNGIGEVTLAFVNDTNSLTFFEYRIDGQTAGSNAHPVVTGDVIHPGVTVDGRGNPNPVTVVRTFNASQTVEVRLALGGERDWDFDWVLFNVMPDAQTREDCRDGGWEAYGFRNQGQCIRFVNTGQDSR